jgi:large subunit ribosomal protein L4
MPKKQKRLAMLSVLGDKAKSDRIRILENLDLPDHKTKNFAALLDKLELAGKRVLFMDEGKTDKPYLAARNIPGVVVRRARLANAYDVLNAEFLVITMAGLKELEEVYG